MLMVAALFRIVPVIVLSLTISVTASANGSRRAPGMEWFDNYLALVNDAAEMKQDRYQLNVDRAAEDLETYYNSDVFRNQPKFAFGINEDLIGYRIAGVRAAVARALHKNFLGLTVKEGYFPDVEKILKTYTDPKKLEDIVEGHYEDQFKVQGWMDAETYYIRLHGMSPIGKMLARLAYNSEHDPDLDARKVAAEAWSFIQRTLVDATNKVEEPFSLDPKHQLKIAKQKIAERWIEEVLEILTEWQKQQAALDEAIKARVLQNQPILNAEAAKLVNSLERIGHAGRGLRLYPPLPSYSCEDRLRKNKLQ